MSELFVITPGFAQVCLVQALLDRVTPELRAVSVSWGQQHLYARLFYEREVDDDVRELVSEAESYAIADLPPGFEVRFIAIHLPLKVDRDTEFDVRRGDLWVYRRHEE